MILWRHRGLAYKHITKHFQDRLNKVHQSCLKETAKRRTLLESNPTHTSNDQSTAPEATSTLTKTLAFQ